MPRSPLARALVLGSALTLAAPAAWAAPRQVHAKSGAAWNLVMQLWADIGCWIDPYGGCGGDQAPALPVTEVGCIIDPHGGCGDQPDAGCGLDPHGGCRAGG